MHLRRRRNFFAGSPLNRLSWLRTSHSFLNAIIISPTTRWLVFDSGRPLVVASSQDTSEQNLAYLTTDDDEGQLVIEPSDVSHSPTEAVRHRYARIVFLGLEEQSSANALPSSDFVDPKAAINNLKGIPYFSLDVSDLDFSQERLQDILNGTLQGREGHLFSWSEPRVLMTGLDRFPGAVFAQARSLVDWNLRNKFCPACGSSTYSMWGGWKISCSSLLPWANNTGRKPCLTSKGLHNFTHPRTDPVVIMIALNEAGDKILLGRGKKFPGKFYSALAGFVEPGETFENAVAREMWEEAGVTVWDVRYHSGQPWPYPANLMVGFYARADETQPIRTDLDNELVGRTFTLIMCLDARWYTRDEILSVLSHPLGGMFGAAEYKKMAESTEGRTSDDKHLDPTFHLKSLDDLPFRLPPPTAIAGVLIRDWVDGKISFGSTSALQRGHL
ncbi:NUDIX hydrolase domain-like protein [Collybia nuda]|uniref:NAD(+) diphosphatase n=1 Tax=Collybia nuda TaxID=64659 RepID=A0A9P6CHA4_9AGAR|nr:NUDIX hydrolase domain-like protein [Collybia nuda]